MGAPVAELARVFEFPQLRTASDHSGAAAGLAGAPDSATGQFGLSAEAAVLGDDRFWVRTESLT